LAQLRVEAQQRARDPEPHRARLAARPPAADIYLDVEAALHLGDDQRLLDVLLVREPREVLGERAAVHLPRPTAGAQEDPGHARLAAADAVVLLDGACHLRSPGAAVAGPRADARDRRRPAASCAFAGRDG